jgi:hypothetical protein
MGKEMADRYRADVVFHAEQHKKSADWPKQAVDVLITVDKHNNHPIYKAAVKWAKKNDIPIIRTSTDSAKWRNTFRVRGLRIHHCALWQIKSAMETARQKAEELKEAEAFAAAERRSEEHRLQQEREAELANEDRPLSELAKDPNGFMRALRLVIRMHRAEGYKSLLIEDSKVLMERIED